MHRYLAVHIQHPRISYAALFRLDRPHRRNRQLVTLREEQTEATVELYLLEERRGEKAKPEKLLHTFRLLNLPARSAGRTQITVEASYDGRGKADVSVLVAGEVRDRASLRVPRESKVVRRLGTVAAALLLLLALFGVWRLLTPAPGGGAEDGAGVPLEPQVEPAEASQDRGESLPSGTDETEQSDSGANETPGADGTPSVTNEAASPGPDGAGSRDDGDAGATVTDAGSDVAEAEAPERTDSVDAAATADEDGESTDPPVEEPPPTREFVVYFDPDRTLLSPEARSRLNEVAEELRENREVDVRIVGHTALFGTEEGRIEISRGRAENVYEYLIARGWEPRERPTVAWEASTDPVTLDRDRQELNRRVEIEIGTAGANE